MAKINKGIPHPVPEWERTVAGKAHLGGSYAAANGADVRPLDAEVIDREH